MTIDPVIVTSIMSAFVGAVVTLVPMFLKVQRDTAKIKGQFEETKAQIEGQKAETEKKRLEAQADYEQRITNMQAEFLRESEVMKQQTKLIDSAIQQAGMVPSLITSLDAMSDSVKDQAAATRELRFTVEKNTDGQADTKTRIEFLLDAVQDYNSQVVGVSKIMSDVEKGIQQAKDAFTEASKATDKNSELLANRIMDKLTNLENVVLDVQKIVHGMDARLHALESRPEPIPSSPINLSILPPSIATEPSDTPTATIEPKDAT